MVNIFWVKMFPIELWIYTYFTKQLTLINIYKTKNIKNQFFFKCAQMIFEKKKKSYSMFIYLSAFFQSNIAYNEILMHHPLHLKAPLAYTQ